MATARAAAAAAVVVVAAAAAVVARVNGRGRGAVERRADRRPTSRRTTRTTRSSRTSSPPRGPQGDAVRLGLGLRSWARRAGGRVRHLQADRRRRGLRRARDPRVPDRRAAARQRPAAVRRRRSARRPGGLPVRHVARAIRPWRRWRDQPLPGRQRAHARAGRARTAPTTAGHARRVVAAVLAVPVPRPRAAARRVERGAAGARGAAYRADRQQAGRSRPVDVGARGPGRRARSRRRPASRPRPATTAKAAASR